MPQNSYLSRRGAANYLQGRGVPITEATLATKASRGDGPTFVKFCGRALYTEEWLDAWLCESTTSPHQYGPKQHSV